MPDTLLSTKLYIPPPRPDLVPRPCLIERLEAGTHGKLTLVSAPAGYGKSTLVSEWIAHSKVPTAWLSLDASDNDITQFFSYLIAALQGINPDIGVDIQSILEAGTDPPIENLLTALVNDITASTTRFALVLDDYHLIDEIKVHQALDFLFDHLPLGMHMVIISRTIPPMPLGRLRVQGELSEIREVDLRFSLDETTSLLNDLMGLALSPEDIQKLEARTEGWIAGLQLAALTLQDHPDKSELIATFSGSHRHLIEYLVDEVMSRQPEEVRTFLLHTSVIEKFNASLCNALMQGTHGREMLNHLDRANLFLNPLDDQRNWYRYHHLFTEFLRQRIREVQPEIVPKLFMRASQWYEAQGMLDEAIKHALAGGDENRAARLLDGYAETLIIANSDVHHMLQWANRLPEDVRAQFPRLCIYHAWALQFEYQLEAAESTLQLAEAHLVDPGELPRSFPASQITGNANAIRAHIATRRKKSDLAIEISLAALKELPEENTREFLFLRGMLLLVLGTAYYGLGKMDSAYEVLRRALPLNQQVDHHYASLSCLFILMNIDLANGYISRVQLNGEKGLFWIEEWSRMEGRKRKPARMLANLRWKLSVVQYERNNLERAAEYLYKANEYYELVQSWYKVYSYGDLVNLHLALGNIETSLVLTRKLKQIALTSMEPLPYTSLDAVIAERNLMLSLSRPDLKDLFSEALAWAEASDLSEIDEIPYAREYEYYVLAKVLLYLGKIDGVMPLLERLISHASITGRNGELIKYLALQAVAYQAHNDTDTALSYLSRALKLGEPEGYVRTFVDLGSPMQDLLGIATRRGLAPNYVKKLLAAFPTVTTQPPAQEIRELIEPLNERELTILRYMAGEPSNQEIADELHLSVNTVKWYARNIYGKLGVGNRRAAVINAREQGIM
jgi:LuxR family maltose regulon positive regulatory protein